jgi:hypothetical protein
MTAPQLVDIGQLADELVRRLESSELPEEIATGLRELAHHGSVYCTSTLFWSPFPLVIQTTAKPDGCLALQLCDQNGRHFWRTTLRPPSLKDLR